MRSRNSKLNYSPMNKSKKAIPWELRVI